MDPTKSPHLLAHLAEYSDEPVFFNMFDYELVLNPGVFDPRNFITEIMVDCMRVAPHFLVLDMGCGAGVLGLSALARGARTGIFADVNESATRNAAENLERAGLADRGTVVHSDLFERLQGQTFDLILFNSPFCFTANESLEGFPVDEMLMRAYFDPQYRTIDRFFENVSFHLNPGGSVQFVCSSAANLEALHAIIDRHQLARSIVLQVTKEGLFTDQTVWYVYRITPT